MSRGVNSGLQGDVQRRQQWVAEEAMVDELALAIGTIVGAEEATTGVQVEAETDGAGEPVEAAAHLQRPDTSRGKNLDVLWVNRGLPLTAFLSWSSSLSLVDSPPATQESSTADNGESLITEELQRRAEAEARRTQEVARRAEWSRCIAGGIESAKNMAFKYREVLSSVKGEEKSLHVQREALRQQIRALDEREEALSKKRKETLFKMKRQDLIVAKLQKIGYQI